jgi:hypothetical protein
MQLFDDIERTYMGYRGGTEPEYAFVNRSTRPPFPGIRDLLEEWFGEVDEGGDDKKDLRARFRSEIDKHHVAALFELYCHGLLTYQGFDMELHKSADQATSRVPDFSASRSSEQLFCLESTLAADTFIDEKSQARLDVFMEGLDKFDSKNYGISVEYDAGPEHQPSSKKARRFLDEKIGELEERAAGASSWPSGAGIEWEYEDEGWKVRFSPMLRPDEDRGKLGQRLRLGGVVGGEVSPERSLYASIKRKASAYGNLTKPYVVAVNTMDWNAEESDVLDALLGRNVYLQDRRTRQVTVARDPKSGAAFRDPQGMPTNTRVSAVLVAHRVTAGLLANAETPVLWHNPWASNPLDSSLWQGPQAFVDPTTYVVTKRPGFDYRAHLRDRIDYEDPLDEA